MQPMFSVRLLLLPALAAGLFGTAGAAHAQQQEPFLSLEEVGTCMCLEEEIAAERQEIELRAGILEERNNELERIGMDIEVKRAAMDPQDVQAIAELKALIGRQQALRDLIRRDIRPSYEASFEAFNAASAAYNEQCAGRRMYKTDIEKLRPNLQCPQRP